MNRFLLLAGLVLVGACAPRAGIPAPTRPPADVAPFEVEAPALLPIPLVEGPLGIRVVYPRADALIQARDSNFIFGSVGNGRASLTINGASVTVHPNGAFLAFLPVPAADSPRYEIVASLGAETARAVHPVKLLPPRLALSTEGPLVVDSGSITPRGSIGARDGDDVRVSVRAPRDAVVWVQVDSGRRYLLVRGATEPGVSLSPRPTSEWPVPRRYLGDPETWSTELPASLMRAVTQLVVTRDGDTLRFPLPAVTPPAYQWALLGADSSAVSDTDRVVIARPIPGGTYKWFLLPGTKVEVTGWREEFVRVRLDSDLEAWVASSEVRPLPPGTASPVRVARNVRLVPGPDFVDVTIPIGERPPYAVEERERALELVLYGTRADTDILRYLQNDSTIRSATWTQETSDRARYRLELGERPFGFQAMWHGDAFVLRVRRAPRADRRHPLRGLTIAVDAGHPPAGSTGPTGLYEAIPTLDVALRLRKLLEDRGATVVMTRSTADTLELGVRPIIARRANAHALVSIHFDALPDGVNPFEAHGTATYFFHPHSAALARAVQRGMVSRMGLRNNGVNYDNLALVRPTWMPAILCEGAFIMLPEHEAAMRTPEFQELYARGVADGLESYFRDIAEEQRAER
jgi:N-acetylmuramoyl-L-alanine amidase